MKIALIVVDVQNDFCEGGSLAIKGGLDVAHKIEAHMAQNWDLYALTVATKDNHVNPGKHFEDVHRPADYINVWPRHCVAGTPGNRLAYPLEEKNFTSVFTKGEWSAAYSGFESHMAFEAGMGPAYMLPTYLRDNGIEAVEICGLALDFCVKATAIDAAKQGYRTTVLRDLTALVHPDSEGAVTAEFDTYGIHQYAGV
jgi:nicotinamidase/pyrazinamidase